MQTVSFDFDGTLDEFEVQSYASQLRRRGYRVIICTARFSEYSEYPTNNTDVESIKEQLGLGRIIYCGGQSKFVALEGYNAIWHLDDDVEEIEDINDPLTEIDTVGIKYPSLNWKEKCEELLND